MVDSFVRSLHVVFMVGIPLAALAFVCALLLKDAPLHGTVTEHRSSRARARRPQLRRSGDSDRAPTPRAPASVAPG